MRVGRLRDRVTIQRPSLATADTLGDQPEQWSDLATVWADCVELNATEHWKQKAALPEATIQVELRYYAGMDSTCRFLWGDRILAIVGITADAKKLKQTCLCKESPAC
jgi:SPP1 family predicted phage head-tail adaptor